MRIVHCLILLQIKTFILIWTHIHQLLLLM